MNRNGQARARNLRRRCAGCARPIPAAPDRGRLLFCTARCAREWELVTRRG